MNDWRKLETLIIKRKVSQKKRTESITVLLNNRLNPGEIPSTEPFQISLDWEWAKTLIHAQLITAAERDQLLKILEDKHAQK